MKALLLTDQQYDRVIDRAGNAEDDEIIAAATVDLRPADFARIVVEFEDGTTAIWSVPEETADTVAADIEEQLGAPDTLRC